MHQPIDVDWAVFLQNKGTNRRVMLMIVIAEECRIHFQFLHEVEGADVDYGGHIYLGVGRVVNVGYRI